MLNDNQISKIPRDIKKLQNLQQLDIGYNNIADVPDELFEVTSLKTVSLDKNKLEQLPESIGRLVNLSRLERFLLGLVGQCVLRCFCQIWRKLRGRKRQFFAPKAKFPILGPNCRCVSVVVNSVLVFGG